MDKQNKYSARPQGFRGSSRPEPARAQEEAPKKKPAAKKAAPKKRAKRRVQRRRLSAKQLLITIAAVLAAALIAFFVIRGVIISRNKTVHMLPEIYDVETTEEPGSSLPSGEGAPEALDNFIAEGSGA